MEESKVLCAANSYNQKYYFNPEFDRLPEGIQEDLQIMCVLFTEEVGGVLSLKFTPEGSLEFETSSNSDDFFYDEIGSELKIKKIRTERRELLEGLELFYRIFYLGEQV